MAIQNSSRRLVVAACLGGLVPSLAVAQTEHDPLTFFYQDARPERLVGFLDAIGKNQRNWMAYPPIVGFFAVIFQKYPDWTAKLLPSRYDAELSPAIVAAAQLSGRPLPAHMPNVAPDPRLEQQLSGLPSSIQDLRISTATHLDICWGAFFASGDPRYVQEILAFFAKTANRSDDVALDLTRIVLAYEGGPKEVYGEIKGKYGQALARELVMAASAEWGLVSNARRHPIVDREIETFIAANHGSFAAKSLSALRTKRT